MSVRPSSGSFRNRRFSQNGYANASLVVHVRVLVSFDHTRIFVAFEGVELRAISFCDLWVEWDLINSLSFAAGYWAFQFDRCKTDCFPAGMDGPDAFAVQARQLVPS